MPNAPINAAWQSSRSEDVASHAALATELMAAALKERGVLFAIFLFDGEQHGFARQRT